MYYTTAHYVPHLQFNIIGSLSDSVTVSKFYVPKILVISQLILHTFLGDCLLSVLNCATK